MMRSRRTTRASSRRRSATWCALMACRHFREPRVCEQSPMDWKASLDWTNGLLSAATSWIEAHPGTANWIQAFGSIAAIVAVFLFVVLQNRGAKSREETDRIRRAQGLALLLIPILSSFE